MCTVDELHNFSTCVAAWLKMVYFNVQKYLYTNVRKEKRNFLI